MRFSPLVRYSLVVLGIYFAFTVLSGFYGLVSGSSLKDVIWLFASSLTTDSEDRTNFIVLGVGGAGHSGGELTDSFIVASYSHRFGTLALLSLPRDLWVEDSDGEGRRINRIYEAGQRRFKDSERALEEVAKVASKIIGLPIHYYAKIDFAGFEKLINALGGVKVNVEQPIDDPYYPCVNLIDYCPFSISAGVHEMDGALALQFARSRETTSDFDRAARQQQLLEAVRAKAFSADILTSPRQLKKIYAAIADNFESNLRFRDLLRLGQIAENLEQRKIVSVVLNNESRTIGGFLYNPDRSEYGGASVLLPLTNDFSQIHAFAEIIFSHPFALVDHLTLEVLNGSGKPGIAERAAYYLYRYGINAVKANNFPGSQKFPVTTVYHYDEKKSVETLTALKKLLPTASFALGSLEFGSRGYDLTVVLGEDWKEPK